MDIENYDDILNLQKTFAATIQQRVQTLGHAKGGGSGLLLKMKQESLKDAEASLKAAQAARDELAKRLDQSIEQQSDVVAQLRTDIENLQKAAAGNAEPVVKEVPAKKKKK